METESKVKRPLVAVGYGPRCVPVMQLTEAAASSVICSGWSTGSLPEMREMTELLNRFGPVVNIAGSTSNRYSQELTAPYAPDGFVTYLDANMTTFAQVARVARPAFSLRWRRPTRSPTSPNSEMCFERCRSRHADLSRHRVRTTERRDLTDSTSALGWPAVLEAPFGPGQPLHVQGGRRRPPRIDCSSALGPTRPVMVLEGYIPDDPARAGDLYAAYVSVESVVANGVISHLALTGRFPPAENFRETGFFIPACLSDDGPRTPHSRSNGGHRSTRRHHRMPPHRNQVHPVRAAHHRSQRSRRRWRRRHAPTSAGLQARRNDTAGGARRSSSHRGTGGRPSALAIDSSCSHPPFRRRSPPSKVSTP